MLMSLSFTSQPCMTRMIVSRFYPKQKDSALVLQRKFPISTHQSLASDKPKPACLRCSRPITTWQSWQIMNLVICTNKHANNFIFQFYIIFVLLDFKIFIYFRLIFVLFLFIKTNMKAEWIKKLNIPFMGERGL